MRNLNLEAGIWYLFTSVEFIEATARRCDEAKEWLGEIVISKRVENFERNGQIFDKLRKFSVSFRRAARLASLRDYELAWNVAGSFGGDVRGFLEQPFHAWMSEAQYKDFFSTRINRIAECATCIECALNNALIGADSFLSPNPDCPERSNDDDGFPQDDIVDWYESYLEHSSASFPSISLDPITTYRIDTSVSCKTGDEVPWTGVWYPSTGLKNHSLTFAVKGLRMQLVYRVIKTRDELISEGIQTPYPQTVAVATTWHPVIPDVLSKEPQGDLRAQAGQPCPRPASGNRSIRTLCSAAMRLAKKWPTLARHTASPYGAGYPTDNCQVRITYPINAAGGCERSS